MRALLFSASLVSGLAGAAAADVIVVDDSGGPGVDFTSISAAVAAASHGDVLLVASGGYAGFTITSKSLVVTAATGATVLVNGRIVVTALGAGQSVVLRGLTTGAIAAGQEGLLASVCTGHVWIESCEFQGGTGPLTEGIRLDQALAVTLVRSQATGGDGNGFFSFGGAGVLALGSRLSAWSCTFVGGHGGAHDEVGGNGGEGLQLAASVGFVSGCTLQGGNGGWADSDFDPFCMCVVCGDPGSGGVGLTLEDGSTARILDSDLVPGLPGGNFEIGCPPGTGGLPLVVHPFGAPSSVVSLVGTARSLRLESPALVGSTAALRASGEPGDVVSVGVALAPAQEWLPAFAANLLVTPPLLILSMGAVDADGDLLLDIAVPPLPVGLQALPFHAQALFATRDDGLRLGAGTHAVIVAGR